MSNFWRALYDYEGLDSTQLSFKAGDVFLVSEVHDGGWFTAESGADIGYVPSNYLEPMRDGNEENSYEDYRGITAADAWEMGAEEQRYAEPSMDDGDYAKEDSATVTISVNDEEVCGTKDVNGPTGETIESMAQVEIQGVEVRATGDSEGESEVELLGAKPPSITLQPTAEGARVTCIPGSANSGRQRLSRLAGSPAPNIVSVQKLSSPVVIRHRSKPVSHLEAPSLVGVPHDSEKQPPPLPEGSASAFAPSADVPPIPPRVDLDGNGSHQEGTEGEADRGAPAVPLRSSTGRLPPPVLDGHQASREQVELLERGGVFQRYTAKRRKPQQRFFSVTMQPEPRIQWRDVEKKKFSSDNFLLFSEATAVVEGHSTAVFQRHSKNGTARSACLAFSVVFGEGADAETLDLEAATEGLRRQWFDALSSLHRQLSS